MIEQECLHDSFIPLSHADRICFPAAGGTTGWGFVFSSMDSGKGSGRDGSRMCCIYEGDLLSVQFLQTVLSDAGIPCFCSQTTLQAYGPDFTSQTSRLWVRREDALSARERIFQAGY